MTSLRQPDFFIVGAPKCGTSSLHAYLGQHPHVFVPDRKDVPFFGSDLDHRLGDARDETLADYLSHFAEAGDARRIGDACVWYLLSTRAAEEIKAFQPQASILVMVRDPVELLYSLHSHYLFMTDEDLTDFEAALAAEPDRREGRRIPRHNRFAAGLRYRDVVRLSAQIERYFDVFGRDAVRVIVYDDLRADTAKVVRDTLSFLAVDPAVALDTDIVNRNKVPRNRRLHLFFQEPPPKLEAAFRAVVPSAMHGRVIPFLNRFNIREEPRPPLDPQLRRRLQRELAPEVERLSELLDRDLTHWSRPKHEHA